MPDDQLRRQRVREVLSELSAPLSPVSKKNPPGRPEKPVQLPKESDEEFAKRMDDWENWDRADEPVNILSNRG